MKVCPVCKTSYEDDAETCDNDGETLLDASDEALLPDNPELRDVIQVRPDEATSMIDLEAMEDKIRERMDQKIVEDRERVAREMEAAAPLSRRVVGSGGVQQRAEVDHGGSGRHHRLRELVRRRLAIPGPAVASGHEEGSTVVGRELRERDAGEVWERADLPEIVAIG